MKRNQLFVVLAFSGLLLASCASGPSKRSFGPYSEAEAFYKQGNYPEAIVKYQEYLALNPQGNLAAIAEYYIAKSFVATKDTIKARESFERVTKNFSGTSWAEFAREQLEALNGDGKS